MVLLKLINKSNPLKMCYTVIGLIVFCLAGCAAVQLKETAELQASDFEDVQMLVNCIARVQISSNVFVNAGINSIPVKTAIYHPMRKNCIQIDRVLGANIQVTGVDYIDIKTQLPIIYFDSKHLFLDDVLVSFDSFQSVLQTGFNHRKGKHSLVLILSRDVTIPRFSQLINALPLTKEIEIMYIVGMQAGIK